MPRLPLGSGGRASSRHADRWSVARGFRAASEAETRAQGAAPHSPCALRAPPGPGPGRGGPGGREGVTAAGAPCFSWVLRCLSGFCRGRRGLVFLGDFPPGWCPAGPEAAAGVDTRVAAQACGCPEEGAPHWGGAGGHRSEGPLVLGLAWGGPGGAVAGGGLARGLSRRGGGAVAGVPRAVPGAWGLLEARVAPTGPGPRFREPDPDCPMGRLDLPNGRTVCGGGRGPGREGPTHDLAASPILDPCAATAP